MESSQRTFHYHKNILHFEYTQLIRSDYAWCTWCTRQLDTSLIPVNFAKNLNGENITMESFVTDFWPSLTYLLTDSFPFWNRWINRHLTECFFLSFLKIEMKISRILFFLFVRKIFVKFFCNILFVKKINFEMFFRKEFFSVNFFRNKFFVGTLFRKFFFMKKYVFGTFWFWIIFFQNK